MGTFCVLCDWTAMLKVLVFPAVASFLPCIEKDTPFGVYLPRSSFVTLRGYAPANHFELFQREFGAA
jgi:hypothetical protein